MQASQWVLVIIERVGIHKTVRDPTEAREHTDRQAITVRYDDGTFETFDRYFLAPRQPL